MEYFPQDEADVIREISNISIGSSATAMNVMLGQPILITTPNVSLIHKNEILNDYDNNCFIVRVQYVQGLFGSNLLILKEDDAKVITDLMMGNDGKGAYSVGEISELHMSAVSEAMNQMTASSATAMSKMFDSVIDISPPSIQYVQVSDFDFGDSLDGETFVKINFRLKIGNLIDSTILQLYPVDLAHSIYKLFQRRK